MVGLIESPFDIVLFIRNACVTYFLAVQLAPVFFAKKHVQTPVSFGEAEAVLAVSTSEILVGDRRPQDGATLGCKKFKRCSHIKMCFINRSGMQTR
jgi:hypothetical protein